MVEGVVTGRGSYSAGLTRLDLNRIWMTRGSESLASFLTLTARVERTLLFFPSDDEQPPMQVAGMQMSLGDAAVISYGAIDHIRNSAASRWGGISVPSSDLVDLGHAINGREVLTPTFTHRIRPVAAAFSRLESLHKAAANLARISQEILAKPEVARAMEQSLAEAMVSCLSGGALFPMRESHHRHARITRRLEEILVAKSQEPLHITELCSAIGDSQRALHALLP